MRASYDEIPKATQDEVFSGAKAFVKENKGRYECGGYIYSGEGQELGRVAVKVNGRRSVRVGFFIGNMDLRIDAKRQDFIRRVGIVAVVVNVGVALCHIGVFIDTLGIHGLYRQGSAYRGVCIRCRHVGRLFRTAGRQCQAQHTGQQ